MPLPVLLDTHVLAWAQLEPGRLTPRARETMENAEAVFVSAITFFEIAQKARLGKRPEIVSLLPRLRDIHEAQGGQIAGVDADIALLASELAWEHRDPFDRIIAATALKRKLVLISADMAFDAVVQRLW